MVQVVASQPAVWDTWLECLVTILSLVECVTAIMWRRASSMELFLSMSLCLSITYIKTERVHTNDITEPIQMHLALPTSLAVSCPIDKASFSVSLETWLTTLLLFLRNGFKM